MDLPLTKKIVENQDWAAAGTMWASWPSLADCHWAVGHRPLSYRPALSKTPPGHHSHDSRQIENNACAKYYGANKVWYHVEMENYAEMR